jgi:hypothetical protein
MRVARCGDIINSFRFSDADVAASPYPTIPVCAQYRLGQSRKEFVRDWRLSNMRVDFSRAMVQKYFFASTSLGEASART